LLIGTGPRRERVEELFRLKGLASWVTFTGGIGEGRKNELLAQAKVGITLSHEEGWGLSITEFMASALPVVAYQLPVYDEVFPGQLERVPLGDWQTAAARTAALLADAPRRTELGERNRAFVLRYHYREVASKELGALQAVLARQPAGS
jgi:glycosyltransferase involved in cell wall biosynthesis